MRTRQTGSSLSRPQGPMFLCLRASGLRDLSQLAQALEVSLVIELLRNVLHAHASASGMSTVPGPGEEASAMADAIIAGPSRALVECESVSPRSDWDEGAHGAGLLTPRPAAPLSSWPAGDNKSFEPGCQDRPQVARATRVHGVPIPAPRWARAHPASLGLGVPSPDDRPAHQSAEGATR